MVTDATVYVIVKTTLETSQGAVRYFGIGVLLVLSVRTVNYLLIISIVVGFKD